MTLPRARAGIERSRSGLPAAELREFVANTREQLLRLQDASLLLTGGTGWLGTWLMDYLCTADDVLRLGLRLAAVSRDPEDFVRRFPGFRNDPRIHWIKSDIRDLRVPDAEPAYVIHAATDSTAKPGRSSPQSLFDVILEGTRRALDCVGPQCRSFLLVSSGAVYGPPAAGVARFVEGQPGGPDPSLPQSAYAEGKRAAEQLGAIAAAGGTPVRIARCFAFLGPHMPFDRHFAIGNFIADAVHGRPILIKSDGTPRRSYLYTSDWVEALMRVLLDGVVGRPYNVGSDAALSIRELAERVDALVGGGGLELEGAATDPADRYVPDTTRLCSELRFVPRVSLDAAILRTAAWYRDTTAVSVT